MLVCRTVLQDTPNRMNRPGCRHYGSAQAGIQRARERGVTFGGPTKLNAKQRRMIAERYAAGETAAALAREFEVGQATVWRAEWW
jgi:hypothetical protein